MNTRLIGIDPDVKESGFAMLVDGRIEKLETLKLHVIFRAIELNSPCHVCISAGWLNSIVNFQNKQANARVRERISERIGANHEIGKQIASFCSYNNVPYTLVRPRTKKLNHKQFAALTGYPERTNQEERDAAMTAIAVLYSIDKTKQKNDTEENT